MLAFVILTTAIVAAGLVAYRMPIVLQNAFTEAEANRKAQALLEHSLLLARTDFTGLTAIATTTANGISTSLILRPFDDSAVLLTSTATWTSLEGVPQSATYSTLVANYKNVSSHPCQPFILGDWTHPHILGSYELMPGFLLPGTIPAGHYPISSLAVQGNVLAVGVASTTQASDPTLFFFRITDQAQQPAYINSFDNASPSKIGLTALAAGDDHMYAANGFSSTDMPNCAYSTVNCRQLQTYFTPGTTPDPSANFQIPTTSPALALTASGATSPGDAVAYRANTAYVGLSKTGGGQELQIVDMSNQYVPTRIGGVAIGRGVNAVVAARTTIYVGTDDNSGSGKAIIAEDVHDPAHPVEIGSHSFSGAGFVRVLVRAGSYLFSGRSYANGASEEFSILTQDASLTRVGGVDIGNNLNHRGVQSILIRGFLAFVLTNDELQLWNIQDSANPVLYSHIAIPQGTATAMTCRQNVLYVGSVGSDGTGYLTVVTSS